MNVLVIGGNRFMGVGLVWRLLQAQHRVTVLNRGNLSDPFGDRVERIRVDRSTVDFEHRLAGTAFDRVVDFAGYSGADARHAVRTFAGRVAHYLFVSTGQVYLVREGCRRPSREEDYAGPVMAQPPAPEDHGDWEYGIGKRDAEDVLAAAPELPSTRLRIPIVNGVHDDRRRIESYLWRLLDGGPLLLPAATAIARHVYSGAVVRALAQLVEDPPEPGGAYNFAQREQPTVREVVERIARRAGARAQLVEVPASAVEEANLSVRAASPFSGRWMSVIDPSKGFEELGLEHPPLDVYLDAIIDGLHAAWPAEPPPGYAQRGDELELLRRL